MSLDLSPEELDHALLMREKQQARLLRMLDWYERHERALEATQRRREAWQKRYPIIFGAASVLITAATAAYNVWSKAAGKGP